tara:strand:+ start:103 stop:285 length:183 start_codon:yes stop_codon:yes gene_type:complete
MTDLETIKIKRLKEEISELQAKNASLRLLAEKYYNLLKCEVCDRPFALPTTCPRCLGDPR